MVQSNYRNNCLNYQDIGCIEYVYGIKCLLNWVMSLFDSSPPIVNDKIDSPHPSFPIEFLQNLVTILWESIILPNQCLYQVIQIFGYELGCWQNVWVSSLHFRHDEERWPKHYANNLVYNWRCESFDTSIDLIKWLILIA